MGARSRSQSDVVQVLGGGVKALKGLLEALVCACCCSCVCLLFVCACVYTCERVGVRVCVCTANRVVVVRCSDTMVPPSLA